MVAAIADCHVPDQFNAYRSPNAVAAQGFWLFQESLSSRRWTADRPAGPPTHGGGRQANNYAELLSY